MAWHKTAAWAFAVFLVSGLALAGTAVYGHCDTMDGPVVIDAGEALETGDPALTLKWINAEQEEELRAVFARVVEVRTLGETARALADRHFYETLVRLHRASEGAPYTGLRPAGTPLDPAVEQADRALEAGSADELVENITAVVESGIRRRFEEALAARERADQSVQAGRDYVRNYVRYVHYVEALHKTAAGEAGHHAGQESHAAGLKETAVAAQPAEPSPEPDQPAPAAGHPEEQPSAAELKDEPERQPARQS
ncbi:MAG: DUF6448 family protein [Candidatus Brocadiia bacterium]